MSDALDALLAQMKVADAAAAPPPHEIVVDTKTGRARQAGATTAEGDWVIRLKARAQRSLYVFTKGILGREYLSPDLHLPTCDYLQGVPPYRKGLLLPRETAKTTMVSHSLPLHILIQDADTNLYFPGKDGSHQRILLAGETETRATDALRVQETAWESNTTLRALWPNRCWQNPRKQSKKWNEKEYIIPRTEEYPDPSVRAIGVGGAVTGSHPSALIKDDLISIEAANSPTVMATAYHWHVASRALINDPKSPEWIIGTRWAVLDIYEQMMRDDPTMEWVVRSLVENGASIYPPPHGPFTLEKIGQLQRDFGVLFPLLYMNSAADPSLTDFDGEMLRLYEAVGEYLRFDEDDRDAALRERMNAPATPEPVDAGTVLTRDNWASLYQPGEGFRLRG